MPGIRSVVQNDFDLDIETNEIWLNAAIGAATRNYLQRVVKAETYLCNPLIPTETKVMVQNNVGANEVRRGCSL